VKSDADDYRYFPEPDLVPVAPAPEWVEELRHTLPQNPVERRRELQQAWGYSDLEMRDVLNAGALQLIEQTVAEGASAGAARKWWLGEPARRANSEAQRLTDYATVVGLTPARVAELDGLVVSGRLNDSMARQVLEGVLDGEGGPTAVADARGLELVADDGALEAAVDKVIDANPEVAAKIRDGKVQAAGALIGQVMKEMKGQADAGKARELILSKLQ
jgi:aspartyl-tRNA(Asn)/glutamyl-tRNA(Gln) amidotransferase subunit B